LEPGAVIDGYQLDDDKTGLPFLERARELDVRLVCVHKGLSAFVDNGSPRDIGPAAKAFSDLNFVIYHSGYELPAGPDDTNTDHDGEEGPYTDELAHRGVNRLIRSIQQAGLGHHSNVYAELGTTWFSLIRRPREAAHVLGKLIATLGEDNIIWGTDSIWYGSAQPLIDALRVFQIPDDMCEQYGYSKLTATTKAKILGQNAASLYGIDLNQAQQTANNDDLAWARQLVHELKTNGFAGLHNPSA
jgi:predicted TIM-barrel fold metal-dependent hydrolase